MATHAFRQRVECDDLVRVPVPRLPDDCDDLFVQALRLVIVALEQLDVGKRRQRVGDAGGFPELSPNVERLERQITCTRIVTDVRPRVGKVMKRSCDIDRVID